MTRHNCSPPYTLLITLYILTLFLLWPGEISPDAANQYLEASNGIFSDHHPPAMSLLWQFLNMIYAGSGLLFAFHLTILYISAAIFVYIFRDSKFKWWYAIYPLIPNILAYTVFIVKDASFVYSYLLAGAIMSLIVTQKIQKYKYALLLLCIILLLYGTAAKFQAQFLLIFFTLGIAYCLNFRFAIKSILIGAALCLACLLAVYGFNSYMVPNAQKSHTWQYVKLYDLTAISLQLDKPLYPDFIKNSSLFDFSKIKQTFDPQRIDDLVFPEGRTLIIGANDPQRKILWDYWLATIIDHPLLYLKIRIQVWSYNLTTSPSQMNNPVHFLQKTSLFKYMDNNKVNELLNQSYRILISLFNFIWLLPLLMIYLYLGIREYSRSVFAPPILLFNLSSVALLLILLFFSMAGVARYVLFCTCFVHASHGFAYRILVKSRQQD